MIVEHIARQSSVILAYSMTEETQFLGSCFPRYCRDIN